MTWPISPPTISISTTSNRLRFRPGASYLYEGTTAVSADMLMGSGLRADLTLPDGSSIPNGAHLPHLHASESRHQPHSFDLTGSTKLQAHFDVINLLDEVLRNP